MIKRTIAITKASYLHVQHSQLVIKQGGVELDRVSIEDIGILLIEHQQVTITAHVMLSCAQYNVAVVFCDESHHPYTLSLPLAEGGATHQHVLQTQIEAKLSTTKRIWQHIVKHKIYASAEVLHQYLPEQANYLYKLSHTVKSGDSTNTESVAARYYFKQIFGTSFIRSDIDNGINAMLNYGYAIVRASVARAVVSAGFHPSIGIFHHNRYNAMCLVDDLIEPLRPLVDNIVKEQVIKARSELTQEVKCTLLTLPATQVLFDTNKLPLMIALQHYTASFKRCLSGQDKQIQVPLLIRRE